MRLVHLFLFLSILLITACDIKVKTPGSSGTEVTKIRNKIELQEKELIVSQAYLQFEDGKLVPEDNKIELKQSVKLKLLMEGWKKESDKVYIGATETITTNDGQTVLKTEDLFADYPDGVKAEDASVISLSAVITGIDKLYDYFLVSFHVWDKKGKGEIKGSYKLYLK